jgi:predicted glycoside hydrolase/deacetylase ChbG (UPF0249 family)
VAAAFVINATQQGAVPALTPLIVCADDFGLEAGVDQAIIALAQLGRISATGCLVQAPHFEQSAQALKGLPIDLGLHLNLTEPLGQTGLCLPLGQLLWRTYSGLIARQAIAEQIETQLDLFEKHVGQVPDFIDGHLHVHQFPIVRELLLQAVARRYADNLPWLRDTRPAFLSTQLPLMQRLKARLIGMLGASSLMRLAKQAGIQSNQGFAGAYDFDRPHPAYQTMLNAWLEQATSQMLLMVHPATHASPTLAFGADRVKEYSVLSGDAFAVQLQQQGLQITRLSALLAHRGHKT